MGDLNYLFDIFEDEIRSLGKALLVFGTFFYLSGQRDKSTVFGRDEVHYAIEAYLPQVYDRSIIAARASQRLTKSLILKALQIDTLKSELRLATSREEKLNGMSELFTLSLAGILSAAHVHSLAIMLHVMKNLTLALVFVLRKGEAQQDSCGGAVVSKLRSWWSDGLQSLLMQSFVENLKQQMELSPFARRMSDDDMEAVDEKHFFSVEALLRVAVPSVVRKALQVVRAARSRRAPHAFSVAGIVTGRDMRELLGELGAEFEFSVVWSDWLTPPPPLPPLPLAKTTPQTQQRRQSSTSSSSSVLRNGGGHGAKCNTPHPHSESDDDIVYFPAGSTAVLHGDHAQSQRERDRAAVESVLGPGWSGTPEEQASREETVRREQLARNQAAEFFYELIHSAAFSELCIAHATEVLERTASAVADLRSVGSYDAGTDSAKMPQVITSLESHRLKLFDSEFDVPPYLRVFCAETMRVTCRRS